MYRLSLLTLFFTILLLAGSELVLRNFSYVADGTQCLRATSANWPIRAKQDAGMHLAEGGSCIPSSPTGGCGSGTIARRS